jgi:hypothetical protein
VLQPDAPTVIVASFSLVDAGGRLNEGSTGVSFLPVPDRTVAAAKNSIVDLAGSAADPESGQSVAVLKNIITPQVVDLESTL